MDVSTISVNAQSSIRIEFGEKVIYFDPFNISDQTYDADYIFLTHDHYDHFSVEDINKVLKKETVFVIPEPMSWKVQKNTPAGTNFPVKPGESYELADFSFKTIAAYNKVKPFHPKKAGWTGYVLDLDGTKVYVAGDTDATKDAKSVKSDIALIPIGGFYTMNSKEAAGLINEIKPKVAIPTHYGDLVGKPTDGEEFKKLVDESIEVVIKL